jgi:hypothetical protein
VFLKNQPKIIFMRTLKKPFTLLLILSHLNAFVLGIQANCELLDGVSGDLSYLLLTPLKVV